MGNAPDRSNGTEPQYENSRRHLIKRPRALQYFEGGELKKNSDGERQAGRFELFLDLLYVALVANFAEDLADHADGNHFVKYILIFTPAWHAWSDLKELMNRYYNDDMLQRVLVLWIMALLIIYGNNAPLVDESLGALRTTVGVYIVSRFTMCVTYAVYSAADHLHRPQNRVFAALDLLGLFLWIPLFFDTVSIRAKVAVTVIAMVYEEAVWVFSFGPFIKKLLNLRYSTAADIPHEIDRAAAFYIIVLGEYLYAIVVGSPAAIGLHLSALRAVWTLVIAFSLNWLYVNADGCVEGVHPLRRSVFSAFTWLLIHLPLAAGLLIGGHICAVAVSEEELSQGQRWLWGGGLGVGVLVLWIIAMLFDSVDSNSVVWVSKVPRMAPRLAVALIFILLPLAPPEKLNPTDLLSIGVGLMVFLVLWETMAGLEKGTPMVESWLPSHVERVLIMPPARKDRSPRATDNGTRSPQSSLLSTVKDFLDHRKSGSSKG